MRNLRDLCGNLRVLFVHFGGEVSLQFKNKNAINTTVVSAQKTEIEKKYFFRIVSINVIILCALISCNIKNIKSI